jgi:hypothetical protein
LRYQGFFVALINQTKRKYNNASNMGFATLKWPLESARHRQQQPPSDLDGYAADQEDADVVALEGYVSQDQVETEHG